MDVLRRVRHAVFLLALFPGISAAAIVDNCVTLFEDATTTVTANGDIVALPRNARSFKFVSTATNNSGSTPTLDVKIQHCRSATDTATCTDTPISFTQCTTGACYGGDSVENKDVSETLVHFHPFVRVVATVGGTSSPSYELIVEVCAR